MITKVVENAFQFYFNFKIFMACDGVRSLLKLSLILSYYIFSWKYTKTKCAFQQYPTSNVVQLSPLLFITGLDEAIAKQHSRANKGSGVL